MKLRLMITVFLALWGMIVFNSCQKEEGITYSDVKIILDVSCAVSGCHNTATQAGNLDCSSYVGIKNILENGTFNNRVLVQRSMPSVGTLSTTNFEKLVEWKENGFKE
jgi:hypothetical protein